MLVLSYLCPAVVAHAGAVGDDRGVHLGRGPGGNSWSFVDTTPADLHLTVRDVNIDLWTILAESACWTRRRPFWALWSPDQPPWPSSSPPPDSPVRRPI